MIKDKKNFFILIFFFVFVSIFYLKTNFNKEQQEKLINKNSQHIHSNTKNDSILINEINKIKIVACPTCYELAKNLNKEKYQIIRTNSTAESIEWIKKGKADLMIAGRTLQPQEPEMESITLLPGYSLLSQQGGSMYLKELENQTVYTDLDPKVIKNLFQTNNIEKVNNVYNYLKQDSIVITSWENTDYTKAKIVHLIKETDNKRLLASRQPTLYCPKACDQTAQEISLELKE